MSLLDRTMFARLFADSAMLLQALAAGKGRRPFPYKLTVALTSRCNARCARCGIWQAPREDELSAAEWNLFFARSPGFSWIDFTGGEVLLRDDFAQIAVSALRANPGLPLAHFPTNGLLKERAIAACKAMLAERPGRLVITVSLDGPPEVNNRLRGVSTGFDRQLETFAALRQLPGVEVVLGYTVFPENAGSLELLFEAAAQRLPDLRPQDIHLNLGHASPAYYRTGQAGLLKELIGSPAAMRDLNWLLGASQERLPPRAFLERLYWRLALRMLKTGNMPIACQALSASCFVSATGLVYPCIIDPRLLGSLREHDYELGMLWNSEVAAALRASIARRNCPQCWTPCEAYPAILGSFPAVFQSRD